MRSPLRLKTLRQRLTRMTYSPKNTQFGNLKKLTGLREERIELIAKRQRLLQRALIECPDSVEARELLSDCIERHRSAIQSRKSALARSIASEAKALEQLPDTSQSKSSTTAYFAGLATVISSLGSL